MWVVFLDTAPNSLHRFCVSINVDPRKLTFDSCEVCFVYGLCCVSLRCLVWLLATSLIVYDWYWALAVNTRSYVCQQLHVSLFSSQHITLSVCSFTLCLPLSLSLSLSFFLSLFLCLLSLSPLSGDVIEWYVFTQSHNESVSNNSPMLLNNTSQLV